MADLEGESAEERMRLLNDVDEISERLSECRDEWVRSHYDNPTKRRGAKLIIDRLEPEMMEMAFDFGKDVCQDLRLYLGKAKELLDRPVNEWGSEWEELIAECDQIEIDIHEL